MDWLPPELVRSCLAFLTVTDLCSAAAVSRGLHLEATSDALWHALYTKRWPSWTLLVPRDSLSSSASQGESRASKFLYRQRALGKLQMKISPAVLTLHGHAVDAKDSNSTPMEVAMCMAPPGRLSKELQITDKLLAQVHFGAGTLHNEPQLRCWLGEEILNPSVITVQWREHASTFGHWVYDGVISRDGRDICGAFHLSILPRKRGTFLLHACDPATHVGEKLDGLPTPHQLLKRVAVKWCSGVLAKAAAREELANNV